MYEGKEISDGRQQRTAHASRSKEPATAAKVCPTCGHRPHNPGSCKARYHVTFKPGELGEPCLCENWRAIEAEAAEQSVPLDAPTLTEAMDEDRVEAQATPALEQPKERA